MYSALVSFAFVFSLVAILWHISINISKVRNCFVGKRIRFSYNSPHPFRNYADVLKELGYPIKLEFTSIFPPEGGDLQRLPNIIGKKQKEECWIGIAPFAAHAGKMYPQDKMELVIRKLTEQHPSWRLFLFGGGKEEIEVLNRWATQVSTMFMCGKCP